MSSDADESLRDEEASQAPEEVPVAQVAEEVPASQVAEEVPASQVAARSPWENVWKRVIVWLLFGAIFGLMPLFALALKEVLSPTGFTINSVLSNGDLLIISAVLSAGALGELLASKWLGGRIMAIISGFFCFSCFAGNTIAYVYVAAGQAVTSEVVSVSSWFFPSTLIASALCVGMAAYE